MKFKKKKSTVSDFMPQRQNEKLRQTSELRSIWGKRKAERSEQEEMEQTMGVGRGLAQE